MAVTLKPVFRLGLFHTERTGREDKLGGLPWGFPAGRWPRCRVCGRPLNFIAQFHSSDAIDLGHEGRALFLFQCADGAMCGDWEPYSGANAAILLEAPELTGDVTSAPKECEVEPEAIILRWVPAPQSETSSFDTHAGGKLERYIGDPPEDEVPPGRFLLQLSGGATFEGPAPTAAETGAQHLYYSGGRYGMDRVHEESPPRERQHYGAGWSRGQTDWPGRPSQITVRESGEWSIECANFGEGVAYVHIDDASDRAILFWRTI